MFFTNTELHNLHLPLQIHSCPRRLACVNYAGDLFTLLQLPLGPGQWAIPAGGQKVRPEWSHSADLSSFASLQGCSRTASSPSLERGHSSYQAVLPHSSLLFSGPKTGSFRSWVDNSVPFLIPLLGAPKGYISTCDFFTPCPQLYVTDLVIKAFSVPQPECGSCSWGVSWPKHTRSFFWIH